MQERINRLKALKMTLISTGNADEEDIKCIDELIQRLYETLEDTLYINSNWGLYPQPEIKKHK